MDRPPRTRTARSPLAPVVLIVLALAATACGGDASTTSTSAGSDGASSGEPGGEVGAAGDRITIGSDEAVVWGDGDYGVLLAHGAAFDAASWSEQATQIAAAGATALAVENIGEDGLLAGIAYLEDERGISDIAFVGGSAGADSMLRLLTSQPDLADQLIHLSPNRVVNGLGDQPKLFIASEDEPVAQVSIELADTSPGDDNRVELLPGSAHAQNIFPTAQGPQVLQLILERIAEFGGA